MSRFGDLIRGKSTPAPEPVVEIAPEPVVKEQSSKLSKFFSGRSGKNKKSTKTEE